MGLEGFDVVLGLPASAIEVFVKHAGVAHFQVGDDEAGVGALRADFDAGDDALDPAPALRAVIEFLETAQLAPCGAASNRAFVEVSSAST